MNASDGSSPATVPIRGVLFDIDETLVDLRSAAIQGFSSLSAPALAHLNPEQVAAIAADFADDGAQAYDRYMAGELTFLGQREVRLQRAYRLAGATAPSGQAYARWAHEYETKVRESCKPFGDVQAFLDKLEDLGIPYGAVSNNVESYQHDKLEVAGLKGFQCVVGSDTAGAPKPHSAPFLAGCAELQCLPAHTLYIGDNPINDYQGAIDAGLQSVLLDRASFHKDFHGWRVKDMGSLTTVLS
ncbi:putative hydrolase of the HAD superfamily [Glutamicibacter mysorens]|uniref:Hydrolase of the HAD superfamily n=1 Tax=Glutamicibacter mysorens TaxID=257984 RepID=A0ABX4MWN2_9MICC|nr:HAD family hydrolase [Glutamicibacter mysorens]PJJ43637.1 putative hydrolase of the HAD superfamily [Glutamicibacter mysorens]